MSRAVVSRLAALVVAFAACAGSAQAVTPPSTPVEARYELVNVLGANDVVADIAVDPASSLSGRPAILFYDTTSAESSTPKPIPLKLARFDRFSWVTTTFGMVNRRDLTAPDVRDLRLSIDALGGAHALVVESNGAGIADDALVYFGRTDQGAPIREQIDVNNVSQIAMTVDTVREPYVAYIKNTSAFTGGTLVIRRRAGGAWLEITQSPVPTTAVSPSFAPLPAQAAFFNRNLAWIENISNTTVLRHAFVSAASTTVDTVDSAAAGFQLSSPQIVVDRFNNIEVAYESARLFNPLAVTIELRRRLPNESTWACIDTGCSLPTGPLPLGFVQLAPHGYVQGAVNLRDGNGNSRILRREGADWVNYPLANVANPQGAALDQSGNVYTTGIDRSTHRDLFAVRIGGPWESKGRIPFDSGISLSHPLDVASDAEDHPIVYARRSVSGPDPRGALWLIGTGNDFIEHPLPGVFTAENASIAVAPDGVIHVAIYDSDQTNLIHAAFAPAGASGTWTVEPVDVIGDVGLSPTMLIGPAGTPMIVYRRRPGTLLLAARGTDGIWVSHTLASGALDASNPVAVASSEGYVVHVSWFVETAGVLRVSTLKGDPLLSPVIATDAVPNTPNRVHGNVHDVAVLGDGGVAIAYNEVIPGPQMQMVYRYRDGNGEWFASTAPEPFGAAAITRVSLDSALLAPELARVAWIAGGRLKYGEKHIGVVSWDSEDLGTIPPTAPMQLGSAGPLRIAYNEGSGLFVLQRLEELGANGSLTEVYGYSSGTRFVIQYCVCFLRFGATQANTVECPRTFGAAAPAVPAAVRGPTGLPARDVLADMRELFVTTPAGRYYLRLFGEHAPEIIRLTLTDPALLIQRTRTLSDLTPGMTALVESPTAGQQYRFKSELIANARAVWQGWAAAGSPELAAAVNNELARTNNLNQFTGMTFTEWFTAISVGNATENLFEDGFE